jgi:hypothetical protein
LEYFVLWFVNLEFFRMLNQALLFKPLGYVFFLLMSLSQGLSCCSHRDAFFLCHRGHFLQCTLLDVEDIFSNARCWKPMELSLMASQLGYPSFRASQATFPKGIWCVPDKKNVPHALRLFLSGALQYGVRRLSPFSLHRGPSGHAKHNEKRCQEKRA